MAEKNDKPEETGFTIIDRRIGSKTSKEESSPDADKSAHSEESKSSPKDRIKGGPSEKEEESGQETCRQAPLPEVDFSSFIISLSTSVYIHLGDIPDPATNEKNVNIAMAKQTIDLIAMLKGKTEGNRTKEEDKLTEEMLYNLRMRFVTASS